MSNGSEKKNRDMCNSIIIPTGLYGRIDRAILLVCLSLSFFIHQRKQPGRLPPLAYFRNVA